MKTYSWQTIVFFSLLVCLGCRQDVGIKQVPEEIIQTIPCPTLYTRVLELFPEHKKATDAVLFADTVQKSVVLTKQSDVFVTFISEGAGYRNTFGWYSYDVNSPPGSSESLELNVLFPDVSQPILSPGDRLRLGNFPAGTVVGFFLIVNGWQEGQIDFDQPKVYTDIGFNQGGVQQHILFEEKTCGNIVLAFEDLALNGAGDKDFNDILFTVSDNDSEKVNTAFATRSIVRW